MSTVEKESQIVVFTYPDSRTANKSTLELVKSIISSDEHDSHSQPSAPLSKSEMIPWHISNRYYDADVYFRLASSNLGRRKVRKRTIEPREVRLLSENSQVVDTNKDLSDGLDELTKQTQDVFAALESGHVPSSINNAPSINYDEHAREVAEQLDGTQAVLIVVDQYLSYEDHRQLLLFLNGPAIKSDQSGESERLLSGFDLGISLVVSVPSLSQDENGSVPLTMPCKSEELEDLYSSEGWEFIDLGRDLTGSMSDEEDTGEENEEEEQGIARIREALMAYTWPGLKRRNDCLERRAHSELQQITKEDEGLAMSELRLQLDRIDVASASIPTQEDEKLAKAFLAQINAEERPEEGTEQDTTQAKMRENLERFLEKEDASWPRAQRHEDVFPSPNNDGAWPDGEQKSRHYPHETEFDDDFSDFVGGQAGNGPDGYPNELTDLEDPLDDFMDDDDKLLSQALAARQDSNSNDERLGDDLQVNFEATLSAILAQAERVRSITDHEKRREEAAKVALSLLDQ